MENILITGGAGFIGSNIVEAMLARGYRVFVIDDMSSGRRENLEEMGSNPRMSFIRGSILDRALLRELIRSNGISLVCHQAARPSVAKSVKDPIGTTEVNITGTVTLFHVAAECGCRRIVFASSSSVYGDTPELPKREDMSFSPQSPYAVSKAAKELYGDVFSRLYGIEVIGLRYFNVYGRRQDPGSDYAAVIPKFISRALAGEPLPIEGDGLQTRDFSYIDDVVEANISALTREDLSGGVFNIACGSRINVLDLAKLILSITGSRSPIAWLPPRPGDVRDSLADIGSARKHLGFEPAYDIRSGLAETVRWYLLSGTAGQRRKATVAG
ncbi:MAG: SDR family oxidoreductase [Alphaproteobacteria bacterium]|uniref:SDR family oxidoreductase n=1 Tax=Candidatus Nitrobium versatile TaxID=2884831 RepID=A0A953JFB6_9BACT|nr:SDR family oxidoreductase [Candidatus Nitrobium versatile]